MRLTLIALLSGSIIILSSCSKPAPAVEANLSSFELTQVPGTDFYKAVQSNNGVKIQQGYVLYGRKTGIWMDYDPDGKITLVQHFIDGQLNGPVLALDNRGQITAMTEYTNGVYDGMKASYKFGRPQEEIPYADGKIHGVLKKYYTNNKIMEEAEYKNNKQDGYYRHYNEDGVIDLEYIYKNGEKVSGGIVTPPQ